MSTYFISDLHLEDTRPQVFGALIKFLQTTAAGADALYILGDFFNAWIGDDDDQGFAGDVKAILKGYTDTGVATYFMHGNRDFLIGKDFAQDTGLTLLPESYVADLYGHKTLLMHGDSLCTRDTEYMQLRQQLRSPLWQQQILGLPLAQRRLLAADLRQKSRSMTAMKAEDIMDVTPEEVEKVLTEHDVTTLIHGHTHRPAVHTLALAGTNAERVVLGDWEQSLWYYRVDSKGASLEQEAI